METKRTMLFLLGLALLALTTFQLASGTDIVFYNVAGCSGVALGCSNVGANVCCQGSPTWAIGFVNMPCSSGRVYRAGRCTTQIASGRGNGCYTCTNDCTGAAWFNCRRRQLLGATDVDESGRQDKQCEKTVSPNAVMYTDETTKATWVLVHEDPLTLFEELKNVDNAEKVNWFRTRGATLSEGL